MTARPYRIAHLSDLHFGAEIPAVVAALAEELDRNPPDLVAISGDLTMRARRREFHAARAFIDRLRPPVLAVPGNHDIVSYFLLERFTDPYARWREHVAPQTEPVYQDDRVGVVGLNTARRAGFYLDWSRGRVGYSRLARCEERLAAMPPGLVRIVVAHHPFLPPRAAPEARLVGGAARALETFARQGVRLVLSGHLHVGDIAQPAREVGAVAHGTATETTRAAGPMTVVLSSTTTSRRLRGEPNAFNEIRIAPDNTVEVFARAWDGARWAAVPPQATDATPSVAVVPAG
ncbi:metallophosphoesterase family protein [Paracraurococcus lichenis]|uniref:Metallophosphoesterase family protein n=1 Tax=Paracraurococcus lichenis TaxID=3064888 RepID=A0ABT9DYP7_9PROT|nr:metallophosphoesterase family protein [Paracraurococcus sp. LOR1-02]MDO9709009.1 metallophosphoesterase family protein [Paracraurococcus sp. LOR1-02]